jgi:hypothetical protein
MKQNEFVFRIQEITEKDKEKYYFFEIDGYTIMMTAWTLCGKFLVEEWVTEIYPQLRALNIDEMEKGEMYYKGTMDKDSVTEVLVSWGFMVCGSEEHKKAAAGLEVDCRIKPKKDIIKANINHKKEQLEKDLKIAVSNDDFESAILIRDKIKNLK